jgi:hypothetical protein
MVAVVAKQKISALIHLRSEREAMSLGRTLETLRPCDETLVVDHGAGEQAAHTAREYGAIIKPAIAGVDDGAYAIDCQHPWILCLLPTETLSEALEAAMFDWKESEPSNEIVGYSIAVRESTAQGWRAAARELRLFHRDRVNWTSGCPTMAPNAAELAGDILRFRNSEGNEQPPGAKV